jgi:hypothetical protein
MDSITRDRDLQRPGRETVCLLPWGCGCETMGAITLSPESELGQRHLEVSRIPPIMVHTGSCDERLPGTRRMAGAILSAVSLAGTLVSHAAKKEDFEKPPLSIE